MDSKIIIGVVAVAVVGIGAFALSKSAPASPTSTAQNVTTQTVTAAPDFSLQKLGGGTIALADYKGKKPVILDFWATWCPNCARDIPHQEAWYQKYQDKIEVIGIDLQEDPSVVAKAVSDRGITYPIALDPQAATAQAYGVPGTNYHVLVDKNGNVVKTIPGDISEQDFLSLISS